MSDCVICDELDALFDSLDNAEDEMLVFTEETINWIRNRINKLLREHYVYVGKEYEYDDDELVAIIYKYKCKHCGREVKFEQSI